MAKFYKLLHLAPCPLLLVPYLLLLAPCPLLLTSCQEGGEARDLFGQWRMDGSDSKYVSFSGSVTLLKELQRGEIYGNFQHIGDSLFMQYYSEKGEQVDTVVVEESFGFRPLNNIRLKIVTLDNDRLVLDKDGQTWRFYKY